MVIPNPIRRWLRKGRVPLQARYEGAFFSRDRSWLPGLTQSALQDINRGDRIELLRRARYFEKNNPLMQQILDLIETNVVGNGINPTPSSSSPDFNARALKVWSDWSKFSDATSRQNFYTLQAIIARAQSVDGEIFCFMTRGDTGRPRLQLIEAHRVTSANIPSQYRKEGYIDADGILLDARGRPAFYTVVNDLAVSGVPEGSISIIPAEKIVHFFEPSRAGQYRGLTLFHSSIVTLHDLDDLQRYEMLAAKDAASRANIIYNEKGEIPDTGDMIGRSTRQTKDDGTPVDRQQFYEAALGGKTVALRTGDKFVQSESLRPSAAMREFWEYLTEQVCRSVGISYAAVKNYLDWGGAALRAAVTSDNRFYDVRSRVLTAGFQRIYEDVIGWSIAAGELSDPPADWNAVRWQPPRRATADIGHESKALLDELRQGIRTERDILGELGQDSEAVRATRADEVGKWLEKAQAFADQYNIPLMTAYALLVAPAGNMPMAPTPGAETPAPVKARFQSILAHNPTLDIKCHAGSDIQLPDTPDQPLPSSFVWMPAGAHVISAGTTSGETWQGKVVCDQRGSQAVKSDYEKISARGQRLWIDFNHEDAAAAGWVKGFEWDPSRGIICSIEWTPSGEKSLRAKEYYTFSPAFSIERETGRVAGLLNGKAAGGLVNAAAFGAAMPALIAARMASTTTNKTASGGNPEKTNMKELLLKLLAALAITPPADANEEQLTALVAKHMTAAKPTDEITKLQNDVTELTAKAKEVEALKSELAEIKAAKAKVPEAVVVAPAVKEVAAHKAEISVEEKLIESVKAFSKESDHNKRGVIYVRDVRAKMAGIKSGLQELLAANSLGSVVGDLIVLRALDFLKYQFPVLSAITTDFSDQQARQGQVIKTRIISQPSVVTLDDTTGWAASDATTTDVSVTIGQPKGVMITYGSTELAGTSRDLFSEQVEACHYALAEDIVGALYALFTAANYGGTAQKTTVALASFARPNVISMGTELTKRKVRGQGRTLLLNPDYFGQLGSDSAIVSLAAFRDPTLITSRSIPNVSDFNVIEAGNLPATVIAGGHLQGFGFTKDAAVMACRIPEDYTRALAGASNGALSVVTNPDTGISVQKVDFVDHKLAKAYSRIAWAYGVAKGNSKSGQLLVEA